MRADLGLGRRAGKVPVETRGSAVKTYYEIIHAVAMGFVEAVEAFGEEDLCENAHMWTGEGLIELVTDDVLNDIVAALEAVGLPADDLDEVKAEAATDIAALVVSIAGGLKLLSEGECEMACHVRWEDRYEWCERIGG